MIPAGQPFGFTGLPGAGSAFDPNSANPMMQSMELLRQMWGNVGALTSATPGAPNAGLDELDKRITDLRAIENWLNLNLTMLRGSIQGLEVQRATISTLRSFAQNVSAAYAPPAGDDADAAPDLPPASPLEIVLGLRPAPGQPAAPATPPKAEPRPAAAAAPEAAASPPPADATPGAQAWWGMLQDQFNKIAQAAAQAVPVPDLAKPMSAGARAAFEPSRAPDAPPPAAPARKAAARKTPPGKPAAKKSVPSARKAPAKRTRGGA